MTVNVLQLVDRVIGIEGGYVNHPSDRGGPTRWGVTEQVARAYGYTGDMRDLPRPVAQEIFRKRYFEETGIALIAPLAPGLAAEMFDIAVNMGTSVPGGWLQRLLNALNRGSRDYGDIVADGRIGTMTVAALTAFLKLRGAAGETVLIKGIEALKGTRYIALTEGDKSQEDFLFGWLANRISLGAVA
jgi:lysozyme family protein